MKVAVICWLNQHGQVYSVEKLCTSGQSVREYFDCYYPDQEIVFGNNNRYDPDGELGDEVLLEQEKYWNSLEEWVDAYLSSDILDLIRVQVMRKIRKKNRAVHQNLMVQIRNLY